MGSFHYRFFIISAAVLFLGACEGSLDGTLGIPETTVNCDSPACLGASGDSPLFLVYLTKSSCDSPFFGQSSLVTGNGEVICNISSCAGQVQEWSRGGELVTTMEEGHYSVCAYIDIQEEGVPNSAYTLSGNTRFSEEGVLIDSSVASLVLETWTDNP